MRQNLDKSERELYIIQVKHSKQHVELQRLRDDNLKLSQSKKENGKQDKEKDNGRHEEQNKKDFIRITLLTDKISEESQKFFKQQGFNFSQMIPMRMYLDE